MQKDPYARSSFVMALGLLALLLFSANLYQYVTQDLLPLLKTGDRHQPGNIGQIHVWLDHADRHRCRRAPRRHTYHNFHPEHDTQPFQVELERFAPDVKTYIHSRFRAPVIKLKRNQELEQIERDLARMEQELQVEDARLKALSTQLERKVERLEFELRLEQGNTLEYGKIPRALIQH